MLLAFVVKHVQDCRWHIHSDEESVALGLAGYEFSWANNTYFVVSGQSKQHSFAPYILPN